MTKIRDNQIRLLTVINFCVGFVLWYGIEKVFLRDELGVGPVGVAQIVIAYMATTLLLDVPAGVIADRWGRKKMLATAIALLGLAGVIAGLSQNFLHYLVATVVWGLFAVAYYGTYEALLFDSLKAQGREKSYQKVDAAARMWFMVGIAISSLISGYVAEQIGLRLTYMTILIPVAVGLYCAVKLYEAKHVEEGDDAADQAKTHYQHFISAFADIARSRSLLLIAFGILLMYLIQTPMYEFTQYVYLELTSSTTLVGVLNGASGIALAIGFLIALRRSFSQYLILPLLLVAAVSIGVFQNYVSVVAIFVLYTLMSLFENQVYTELQHSTKSSNRAAVTSAANFVANTAIIPVVIVFGAIAERSIWTAYLSLSVLSCLLIGLYIALRLASHRSASAKVGL